jgi:SNF2 family DNA or RNA helicase
VNATLRDYQLAGFRWMQFLARHGCTASSPMTWASAKPCKPSPTF